MRAACSGPEGGGQQLVAKDENAHSANFGMSYSPSRWLSVSPGYRYQIRKIWDHVYAGEIERRELTSRTEYETMSLSVNYNPSKKNTLTFSGSKTKRKTLSRRTRRDQFITLSYAHTF